MFAPMRILHSVPEICSRTNCQVFKARAVLEVMLRAMLEDEAQSLLSAVSIRDKLIAEPFLRSKMLPAPVAVGRIQNEASRLCRADIEIDFPGRAVPAMKSVLASECKHL